MDGGLPSISEANELVRGNKFHQAKEAFDLILEREPENFAAWYGLGVTANLLNENSTSIFAFEKVLEFNQYHAPSAANLAFLYSEINLERSKEFAKIALELGLDSNELRELESKELEPELPLISAAPVDEGENLLDSIAVLIENNEFEEALEIITPILESGEQHSAELWATCSLCLVRLGLFSDALDSVNYALSIDSTNNLAIELQKEILTNINTEENDEGEFLSEDDFEEINEDSEEEEILEENDDSEIIALEDSYVVLVKNARDYSENGNHASSVQAWKTIIQQFGSKSESWHGMADALEAAGHFEKAKQCRNKGNEINSEMDDSNQDTDSEVDLIAAAKDAEEIMVEEPKPDTDINISIEWYNKGLVLLGENKNSESLNCFDKSISLTPRTEIELRVKLYNGRGHALHQLGEYAESIQSYHQAISLAPKIVSGRTLYNMGSSYAALEHFHDALRCFEQALERDLESEDVRLCKNQINRCKLLLKEIQKNS